MSTATARTLPRPSSPARRQQPAARPDLRIVNAPAQARSRGPFIVLCMLILMGALLGTLLLNTAMAQGSFERQELTSQLARLTEKEQALTEQLDVLGSPGQLAQRATDLGMVRSPQPAFIRLADGVVIGEPTPAG